MKANSDAWIALEDEEEGDGEETARALFVEEEEEEDEEGTDLESDSHSCKKVGSWDPGSKSFFGPN